MKNNLHTFIMGILTLFAIYLYFLSAEPLSSSHITFKEFPTINIKKEELNALNYLNKLRTNAGLIPLKSHHILAKAAKNHANYLTNHLTYGHKEEKRFKDFTGLFASERIQEVGFSAPQVIENVSANNKNYKESIDGLFAAIYHRMAFLDFRLDIIGIGVSQNKTHPSHTAFVYDMSTKELEKLYKQTSITQKQLTEAIESNKNKNNKVVIYPYDRQRDVPPAFFDELPDPLPNYKVSGYPISVSFNPAIYKKAKLISFKLFNRDGIEITDTTILDAKSDPNRRLTSMDFVLFPLKRLAWNQHYYVKFKAIVDNRLITKEWSFHTRKFNKPLYTITKNHNSFAINIGESYILYFPPDSKDELLGDIRYPSNYDIEFIDKNTIKLTLLYSKKEETTLNIGNHVIKIYEKKYNIHN